MNTQPPPENNQFKDICFSSPRLISSQIIKLIGIVILIIVIWDIVDANISANLLSVLDLITPITEESVYALLIISLFMCAYATYILHNSHQTYYLY